MRRTPVLIVGGGPAGSAAAITLARAGLTPELFERCSGARDVVCGGFVGWDALRELRSLGVDIAALGARPITRLRLVAGSGAVEADLPHAAAGLSRRVLDSALLEAAEAAGARVQRGRAVRSADLARRIVRAGNEEVAGDALFLATGKHELRGAARVIPAGAAEPAVGLRAALPPLAARQQALSGVVELHLFEGGYAGLLQQEDGSTNLCLSVSRARLAAAGGTAPLLQQVLAESPRLAERIGPDLPARFAAVAGVPYGWRNREAQDRVFRLGDQAAVIASLAGDGIAIALASGRGAAAALLARGAESAAHWQRDFRRQAMLPLAIGEALRFAAERSWLRRPLLGVLRAAPGLAGRAAHLTRIAAA